MMMRIKVWGNAKPAGSFFAKGVEVIFISFSMFYCNCKEHKTHRSH